MMKFLMIMVAAICATTLFTGCAPVDDPDRVQGNRAESSEPTGILAEPVRGYRLATVGNRRVEVGCGLCIYKLEGYDRCRPVAHIDERHFRLSGQDVEEHAHEFCSAKRSAVISGDIMGEDLLLNKISFD